MNWKEKIFESVIDVASTKGPKPVVKRGDPFAHLSARIRAKIKTKENKREKKISAKSRE